MSRGRVNEFPDEELPPPRIAFRKEEPRDEPAKSYTVCIVVDDDDAYGGEIWWSVKSYESQERAIHLAETIAETIHKELGIRPERLED